MSSYLGTKRCGWKETSTGCWHGVNPPGSGVSTSGILVCCIFSCCPCNQQATYICSSRRQSHLCVFGYACFLYLRPYNQHKLQFRSKRCTFFGFEPNHKGYKCLDDNGRVFVSRHVVFDETQFPFQQNRPSKALVDFGQQTHQQSHIPLVTAPVLLNSSLTTLDSSSSMTIPRSGYSTRNSAIGHLVSSP